MTSTNESKQPTALILIADGSEEIEFVTPYDVLTRAGFTIKSVGVQLKNPFYAECSRAIKIIPDIPAIHSLPDHLIDSATILILPGGGPGAATFCADDATLRLVREFRNEGKWIACICAGTTALVKSTVDATTTTGRSEITAEAGKKVRVTSHPSVKEEIVKQGWEYAGDEERVVVNGKVVTSRGPGSALAWSLKIVELLLGKEKMEEIRGPMMTAETL